MSRKSEPALKNRIKTLRSEKKGMTQQMLADKVGVTRQTIIALEAEGYTPSLTLALKLAAVFKQSVEKIFWIQSEGVKD